MLIHIIYKDGRVDGMLPHFTPWEGGEPGSNIINKEVR
jgi:hypothetical protein